MYIKPTSGYYEGCNQCVRRQLFLILIQPEKWQDKAPTKALVRMVAMKQLGHFMMGYARVYGNSIILSGSYGNDGLPTSVSQEIYDRVQVELPDRLHKLWDNGGGWNSAGSEADEMRKWALENLEELRK